MNEQILNIKFVREVEKYPCLYNNTLTDYSRKDVTERAWRAVGKVFNLTESQSKDKWKNLRAVFVRHIKPATSGSASKNKKPYYLADAMDFIIPYIKVLNTNLSGDHPQEATEQEDDEEATESKYIPQVMVSSPGPDPLNLQNFGSPSPVEPICSFRSNLRKIKKACSTDDEFNMDYFQTKKAKLQQNNEDTEDAKRMFLLSLLPDVRTMSDSQTRTFKRRVLALVDEIFEESQKSDTPAGNHSSM